MCCGFGIGGKPAAISTRTCNVARRGLADAAEIGENSFRFLLPYRATRRDWSLMEDALRESRQQAAAGRFAEAEATCRRFLQQHPQHVEALSLLAGIYCQWGEFDKGIDCLQKALRFRPEDAALNATLGDVYSAADHVEQAIECYRRTIELNPLDAQTHNNLGAALKRKGDLHGARVNFEAALKLQPELALTRKNLADLLLTMGQHDQAVALYEQAVSMAPDNAELRNGLGQVRFGQGNFEEAIAQYREALRLAPQYAAAEENLASALRAAGQLEASIAHSRNAIRLQPERLSARLGLATALRDLGQVEEAVAVLQALLSLAPRHADARNNLGLALTDLGRFDEAIAYIEEALRLNPSHVSAYHNLGDLARQGKYRFSADQLERIRALLASPTLPLADRCLLNFTLGGVLNNQGQFDEAFGCYQQANDIMQHLREKTARSFDRAEHQQLVDATIATFDQKFVEDVSLRGLETDVPIFVVGMPRSGSTLVDRIISSHPDAASAGELRDIPQLASQLSKMTGNVDYPAGVVAVNERTVRDLAQSYLERLYERTGAVQRIIDKAPVNFMYLGLISLLFPHARIIHCQREAMDIGLSCYFTKFTSLSWAWRLEDIGFYYAQYERLMAHWRAVLPLQMFESSYEALIADPATVTRELLDFCGLPWNDRCLEFYKADSTVQTASRVQVRQPIYRTSVGHWKNYESHLVPLRRAIEQPHEA
ncbi:MAG: sulfotransferase family protein [Planctomycetota bacterium]|nr:MAG: sulfotransferase family protein [Planctomycetota bacterium]